MNPKAGPQDSLELSRLLSELGFRVDHRVASVARRDSGTAVQRLRIGVAEFGRALDPTKRVPTGVFVRLGEIHDALAVMVHLSPVRFQLRNQNLRRGRVVLACGVRPGLQVDDPLFDLRVG